MLVRLKEIIRKQRLRQYEVAHGVGMTETRLSRIATGRELPTAAERDALAAFLKVHRKELFDDVQ